MIRIRRYRLFLAVVVFVLAGAYFFNRSPSWDSGTAAFSGGFGFPDTTDQTAADKVDKPIHENARPPNTGKPAQHRESSSSSGSSSSSSSSSHTASATATATTTSAAAVPHQFGNVDNGDSDGLKNLGADLLDPEPQDPLAVHWSSQADHFPITSTIQLPTGTPVTIPKIQFEFDRETSAAKEAREEKLAAIKASFQRSWDGYRKYAWMHDELKPVSGGHKDPFCGWAATLVDSLDTLWIMGLEEEFQEAAKAVGSIDFTTSSAKNEIPVFETTIRYLGGLLGAYDISGRKAQYKILLDKAVELAEVMMGAFDTPNRMPVLYYPWRPSFASQPRRAGSRAVMSEIGSLSMEFTHLSQLTGEPRYYDAVARITDAFEEFQNRTKLPGMWPLYLDTSGCTGQRMSTVTEKVKGVGPPAKGFTTSVVPETDPYDDVDADDDDDDDNYVDDEWKNLKDTSSFGEEGPEAGKVDYPTGRRGSSKSPIARRSSSNIIRDDSGCVDAGFSSPYGGLGSDSFTLSGMADSTYEYLPKQYLMLGGLTDQYKKMYLSSIEAIKEFLLYRPMIKENRNILFTGQLHTNGEKDDDGKMAGTLETEVGHLNCFVGGMVGLGAKIFDRPEEMDIAEQLTDGCVWLYDSTESGIMPETSDLVACEDMKDCPWNQTIYYAALDPYFESTLASPEPVSTIADAQSASKAGPDQIDSIPAIQVAKPPEAKPPKIGRQLGSLSSAATRKKLADTVDAEPEEGYNELLDSYGDPWADDAADAPYDESASSSTASSMSSTSMTSTSTSSETAKATGVGDSVKVSADTKKPIDPNGDFRKPLSAADRPNKVVDSGSIVSSTYGDAEHDDISQTESHEQFVLNRISSERLPAGVSRVSGRHYILRPEAIESVFYMYRMTGNSYWRDKGWKMFQSIEKATKTQYGSSGIKDVTSHNPTLDDKMESFWLAETLKYFYLLFSHEGLVSLDDWVLNTEAHPFLRPDVATRSDESSLGYPG